MFKSAVVKLTGAFLAIVMAISITFSMALYRVAVSQLEAGFHNQYLRWLEAYRPFGLRQPSNPAQEIASRSHDILMQMIYLNILVFLITGVACYILARRTLRPIEAAHEQQKRFTADVSHELRTPLTSLKMETEVALLEKNATKDELRSTLGSNLEEIKRMETLINGLLQLSTAEVDSLRNDFTQLYIDDVVNDAIRITEKLATQKKIHITSDLKHKAVRGEVSSLKQLFVILIENAVKYSPSGSLVSITFETDNSFVYLRIKDQGVGIAANDLPHVFDRFYRADKSRENVSAGGFGLGLSLAKFIADLHSAEIIINSSLGKGTTVTVGLPKMRR